jgi:sigma-B regulation protein RsbU (phosphoserine phosphatase)
VNNPNNLSERKNIDLNIGRKVLRELLDPKWWQEVFTCFYELTKLPWTMLSLAGDQLWPTTRIGGLCLHLGRKPDLSSSNPKCIDTKLTAHRNCLMTGEPITFKCWAGLGCFTVPLKLENKIIATITSGHALVEKPDLKRLKELTSLSEDKLTDVLRKMPLVDYKLLQKYAEWLTKLTSCLVNQHFDHILKRHHIESKIAFLTAAFEASELILSTFDIDEIIQRIAQLARVALSADASSIFLIDEESGLVYKTAYSGFDNKSDIETRAVPLEGIIEQVVSLKQPLVLRKIDDWRLIEDIPLHIRTNLRSMLALPLIAHDKIMGILTLYSCSRSSFFEDETEILSLLTSQAAIAIQNAQLHREIIRQREKIYFRELKTAQTLQQSLLPSRSPKIPTLDIGFVYTPAKQIGGDFYDFIDFGEYLDLTIGDVSGKSLAAALLVSMQKYVIRALANINKPVYYPLLTLNRMLYEDTEADIFVSVLIARYNIQKRTFTYANAGQLPPLRYSASKQYCHYMPTGQIVLGVDAKAFYSEETISLGRGDIIVLYTDGVTEAKDEQANLFGQLRLKELIYSNSMLGAQTLANLVLNEVLSFTRGELNDDFTLLILKGQ